MPRRPRTNPASEHQAENFRESFPFLISSLDNVTGKQPHVDFVTLHILHHAAKEPVYGLWMIEELQHHGYSIGASQLYPKFHRLEKTGLLVRQAKVVDGKLRKYYRASTTGKRYLREQRRRLMELAGEALSVTEIEELLRMARQRESARGKKHR